MVIARHKGNFAGDPQQLGGRQFRGQSSAISRQKRKVGTKAGLLVNKQGVTAHSICIGLLSHLSMVMMMMMEIAMITMLCVILQSKNIFVFMMMIMVMTMMIKMMMQIKWWWWCWQWQFGMCRCEAHWSQRSEGLTEQTMEHDVHYYDDDDDQIMMIIR